MLLIGCLALAAHHQAHAAGNKAPIPSSCPVTRSTPETRFTPFPSAQPSKTTDFMFWYGSHSLYTQLFSDGRWRGIRSERGVRNKSFWFRKNAEWLKESQSQLIVTMKRLDADGPMLTVPRITNAILGAEVAMLLMLELPERGCWQVTANYKSDYVSFVTWMD